MKRRAAVGSRLRRRKHRPSIVGSGLGKRAVYRDLDGVLHRFKAACPHLGCPVSWNGVERSWDCPCHGSRFDCSGRVIVGPANRDLTSLCDGQVGEGAHGEQE